MKIIFLIFLLISLGSNLYAQNLRFDGIYIKIKDSSNLVATNEYLRFYEDSKTIICTTTSGSPQEIKKWFNLENKNNAKGNYNLKNDKISFTIKIKAGEIQYTGKILEDGILDLKVESFITGHKSHDKFKFINQTEFDNEELDSIKSTDKISSFEDAEIKPQFIGGEESMREYIGKNLQYPSKSKEKKIEGKIFVQFIIEKDGSCSNPKLLTGLDEDCNKAVINLINNMPKWSPAKNKTETIRCYFILPINFTL